MKLWICSIIMACSWGAYMMMNAFIGRGYDNIPLVLGSIAMAVAIDDIYKKIKGD